MTQDVDPPAVEKPARVRGPDGENEMVHVQLDKEWTDGNGRRHAAGERVDVDPGTLAELERRGVVTPPAGENLASVRTVKSGDGEDHWAGPGSPPNP